MIVINSGLRALRRGKPHIFPFKITRNGVTFYRMRFSQVGLSTDPKNYIKASDYVRKINKQLSKGDL